MFSIQAFLIISLIGLGIGLPICLPWILAKVGFYKRWYLVVFIPPFAYKNMIYIWPVSFMFLSFPLIGLFQGNNDIAYAIAGGAGIFGMLMALYMIIYPPRWAKPRWLQYIDDNYSRREINNVFIPAWRALKMQKWSKKMDSVDGIEEMVTYARQWKG